MNQILSTNNDNNYKDTGTKKIIIIFCIAVILIACAIIFVAMYFKNNNKEGALTPEIEIIRQEEREISIKVTCEDGIDYISYSWNDEKNNKVNLNGSKDFERTVNVPANPNNTLKIEAVSSKGIKGTKQEEFDLDIDSNKPEIEEMTVSGSTLHIKATDDIGIDYLSYQWEDEEERKVPANEEDNKVIETDISIKRGTYKLTVKVFDLSGNKEEVSKLITGVNQPGISALKLGDKVQVTATHDMGFKRIEYLINDKFYVYDESYSDYDKEKTTIQFEFPLIEGKNVIKVNAYSLEKLSNDEEDKIENYSNKFYIGECTYEQ